MFRTNNMGFPECQAFPILKLPKVVLFHVIEYLNKKQKGILSRVNRQFREIMNSPNIWKYTTFVLSPNKIDHCKHIVNLLGPRKVKSVIFKGRCAGRKEIQQPILKGIPSLRDISISNPCRSTLYLIVSHAKGVTKLHLGMVSKVQTPNLTSHFKELENLEDVSIGRDVFRFDIDFNEEIKNALCYHGNLRSLQLHNFYVEDLEWIAEVVQRNPKLESLGLFSMSVRNFYLHRDVFDRGFAEIIQNSTLKELILWKSLRSVAWMDLYPSLASLDLGCNLNQHLVRLAMLNLHKLPNLKKLDLTNTNLRDDMFLENHPKLCSLELKDNFLISGRALKTLASVMGNSLRYLGLSSCAIQDTDLIPLTAMFPCLNTLDLSSFTCTGISDKLLYQDLYNGELRKIILKHCPNISEEAVQMVRKNSKNKIIVIF